MFFIDYLYYKYGQNNVYHSLICFVITFFVGAILGVCSNMFGVLFGAFACGTCASLGKQCGETHCHLIQSNIESLKFDYIGIIIAMIILFMIYC